jgi:aldose 1-epimerase
VTLLLLRAGDLSLELAPQAGGSIARFFAHGVDLLRPTAASTLASGRGNESACYPLVPFSNRIANGRIAFDGESFDLQPNWPGLRHPMHGDGWARPWQVAQSDSNSSELVYEHDGASGWPLRYRASQIFRLSPEALTVQFALENLEARPVPGGIGLHPFFVRDEDSSLSFKARRVWLADAEVLPTKLVEVPENWDFAAPRRVADVALDNCFTGWDGKAEIVWPRRGLRMGLEASEPFRNVVVYTPPGRPFFCVEPVSHANGAIASTRVAAGATLQGEIVFRVFEM